MTSVLTIHENSPDELLVGFVKVSSAFCVTENCLSEFCQLLKPSDKRQDANFAFLRNLHFLHLSYLT